MLIQVVEYYTKENKVKKKEDLYLSRIVLVR